MIKIISSKIENTLFRIFEIGIAVKFFNGLWEIASGLLILFVSKTSINRLFYALSHRELLEDPRDLLINLASGFLNNLSHGVQVFIAIYILIHGCLNLFLSIQLYRQKIWAYIVTIWIMIIFIIYQIYRIYLYHSLVLTIITIFDILFVTLAWHEYKRKKIQINALIY